MFHSICYQSGVKSDPTSTAQNPFYFLIATNLDEIIDVVIELVDSL